MLKWLQRAFGANRQEHRLGAPPVRRVKTHVAASGYVYHFYFEGYIDRQGSGGDGTAIDREYAFRLHPEQPNSSLLKVVLPAKVRNGLEVEAGRTLSSSECYAVAKLSLFALLDETATPSAVPESYEIKDGSAQEIWQLLGLS